jgi:hypothetical protein
MDFTYLAKQNKNLLAITLCRVGKGLRERGNGGNVNSVQYKSDWNCHFESPQYKEYIQIRNLE